MRALKHIVRCEEVTRDTCHLRPTAALLAWALALTSPVDAQFCGNNEPAFPVPLCRTAAGGDEVACSDPDAVTLWPQGFRPGRPSQQLPGRRDSTQWTSDLDPEQINGLELFRSLDVEGDWMYVAYNVGIQAWTLAPPNAEDPLRVRFRDGWQDDFLAFPTDGEQDHFIYDIDALGTDGDTLIAVAGEDGVGPSIWEHQGFELVQLYQDAARTSRQIRTATFAGRHYAFAAGGGIFGIYVYDMSAAAAFPEPCLELGGGECPGVFLGELGTATNTAYLDLIALEDRLLVAAGREGGLPAEIWRLDDPSQPDTAERVFSGLPGGVQGISLFEARGDLYLGAVERRPDLDWEVNIYDASGCATGAGSCGMTPLVWSHLPPQGAQDRYLTFSTSGETPFLYYGPRSADLSGRRAEGLFDLSCLGTTDAVVEITETGGAYVDECTGLAVDYWGDYYADNGHGLRNIRPQVGKFQGGFFYRAAFGILDVHVWTGDPACAATDIFFDGFESGDTSNWDLTSE